MAYTTKSSMYRAFNRTSLSGLLYTDSSRLLIAFEAPKKFRYLTMVYEAAVGGLDRL